MKPLKLITFFLMLITAFNIQAMIIYNPEALAIDDFNGKLYKIMDKDIGKLASIDNLDDKLLPQDQWLNIITNGDIFLAHVLLDKLTSYLPKNELWDYIQVGLLRHENKFNNLIADHAYQNWSTFANTNELLKIRTNPKYRKNLSVLTTWNFLFKKPSKEVDTIDKAVEKLEQFSFEVKSSSHRTVAALRTTIALSTDYEKLQTLIHHKNFHIALSAYYALSRINPQEDAFTYVSENLNNHKTLEYDYFFSDEGSNAFINLAQANYDLFIDYLTPAQLKETVKNDLRTSSGMQRLIIRNDQLAQQYLPYKTDNNSTMYILQGWELQKKIRSFSTEQLKKLIGKRAIERYMTDELFSKKIVFALIELSYIKGKLDEYDIEDWLYVALKVHNDNAKRLITFFLTQKNPNIKLEPIVDTLNRYRTWPRDWQDLKNKALEIYEQPGFKERIEIYNKQQELL